MTFADSTPAVVTVNGIRVLPDQYTTDWAEERSVSTFPDYRPADAPDRTLQAVAERYGERTTDVVAMQLECPRPGEVR